VLFILTNFLRACSLGSRALPRWGRGVRA
jgi:hypothetical protein